MTPSAIALLAACSLVPQALVAQPPQIPVPTGARVRVGSLPPRSDWVVGRFAHADSVRIVLWTAPRAIPDTFPLAAVQALEVSQGRPRALRVGIGMVLGGLALGSAAALVTNARVRGQDEGAYVVGAVAVAGVAAGVIAGGAVGGLTAPERWRRVPIR